MQKNIKQVFLSNTDDYGEFRNFDDADREESSKLKVTRLFNIFKGLKSDPEYTWVSLS
jgi:hypothetical protein